MRNSQTHFTLILCALIVCTGSVWAAFDVAGNALSKANRILKKEPFIAERVPAGHDFTKVKAEASYKAKHLIVRFAPETDGTHRSAARRQATLNALGGGVIKRRLSNTQGLDLIELPGHLTVEEALEHYNGREDIFYAEPDYIIQFALTPNEPNFLDGVLWGLHNPGHDGGTEDADIDAPEAWDIRTDAEDIIVAVIDSGVDYNHEDLDDNMWVNSGEIPDNDIDDDGNGYIDDIHGYDFFYNDHEPEDGFGHGTGCAGIIGAEGNNGTGIVGVCWNVQIMALKIGGSSGPDHRPDVACAIEAVEYATSNGARIISNSWGGTEYNQGLKDEIDIAGANGCLFVAAAGSDGDPNNDITPNYPPSYTSENIISVMATNRYDLRGSGSHYGATSVDIGAPGEDILTCGLFDSYIVGSGTSFAAPYVAGACALVWAENPGLSHLEVKERILDSVDKLDSLEGLCVSEGRLNLHRAMPLSISVVDDVDDPNCRNPQQEITYTIEWKNTSDQTYSDVKLIDHLPAGVYYDYIISFIPLELDLNYNVEAHTYTWSLDTIEPNDTGSRNLTVTVNNMSEPGLPMRNVVELFDNDSDSLLGKAAEDTPICCWDTGTIIYVDQGATGCENGVNWTDAYTNLQDALYRAANTTCPGPYTIYVAQGTYSPNWFDRDGFNLIDQMAVYGGFKSGGCDFGERNPKNYVTSLIGQGLVDKVVTMGDETRLDGFTVTGAATFGNNIYGSEVDFTIENCKVEKSDGYGIRAIDGNVTIKWCEIKNNELHGIRHQGEAFTLTVENSQIRKNMRYGVFSRNSTPTIKNSVISENDLAQEGRQGIRIINPTYSPVLHNNTIAYNRATGISFSDDGMVNDPNGTVNDPNDRDWPDVQNCILWYNDMAAETPVQFARFSKECIHHSCIYDPNSEDLNLDYNYNFSANPKFAYYDPDNVHLAYDSPCRDRGNQELSYDDQVDMDSENRVVGDYIDIGADELYSCDGDYSEDDFYNALDWNADGVVNMHEFSKFSSAWLTEDPNAPWQPTDPSLIDNWNAKCNLDPNGNSAYTIDLADLVVFASETPWLWEACWRDNYIEMYGMMMGGGGGAMGGQGMEQEMMESTPADFEESSYEDEEQNVYASMSESELVLFVKGIYEMIELLEIWIEEDPEIAESATEIIGHLEAMLVDIKESRQ